MCSTGRIVEGNLNDVENGVVILLGTGIGGGIIIDRKLYKGNDFFAGEFSYMMTDYKTCKIDSCLAFQGGARALVENVINRKRMPKGCLNGKQVFDLIYEEDEDANICFDQMINALTAGIFSISSILNPQRILIGGGISKQPIVVSQINSKLQEIYENLPFEIPHVELDTCKFYNDSNLIGALYHHIQKYLEERGGVMNDTNF